MNRDLRFKVLYNKITNIISACKSWGVKKKLLGENLFCKKGCEPHRQKFPQTPFPKNF